MAQVVQNGIVGDWRLSDDAFLASFHLPSDEQKADVLQRRNPFPRESRIVFQEDIHKYYVDGIEVPRSVTGFLHTYAATFDPQQAISSMRAGKNWPTKQQEFVKEDGEIMTDDEIAARWQSNGHVQRSRGTLLHYQAEQFLNECTIEEPQSPEFQQFMHIYAWIRERFEVYRTELSIFHCGLRLAGQVDCICKNKDGNLIILDWKRSKEIRSDGREPMKYPLQFLPDSNYWHYALQLNVYKYMLESEYGFHVAGMFLGVVHPKREGPLIVELPALPLEIAALVEYESEGIALPGPQPGPLAPFTLA